MVDLLRIFKRPQQAYSRRPESSGRIADHTDLTDNGVVLEASDINESSIPV
jgi:hypothetical protein